MDWITGIQRALDYVEEHITEPIDYEEAARRACSSSFHFQRVFSVLCGFTLGEYIRLRRLTLAGSELAGSDEKVIDVALKYGYDTPESFSRAFTRFHGITPSQARNNGAVLKSFSRLSVKLILSGGNIMDYRIETKEAFKLVMKKKRVSAREELTPVEISAFWQNAARTAPSRRSAGTCRRRICSATGSWAPASERTRWTRTSPTPSALPTTVSP